MLHAQGIQNSKGDVMNDDDDYELANLMFLVAKCILALFALVGVAGIAGFIWGMS